MKVLMITSEWPTVDRPHLVPFIVRQVEFLRRAGIELEVFHYRGNQSPLNYLLAWLKLRLKLLRSDYDLIHAQWGQSGLLAFPKKLPLVVTFRGDDVYGIIDDATGHYTRKGKALQRVSRFVARRADQVILVSAAMADLLPCATYHVIPSGVDLDLFQPIPQAEARARLDLPADVPLVLFGGSPRVRRKRYDLAVTVVDIVKQKRPEVQLIALQNVPHAAVPLYMNACDALLFTSAHEGSPNVVKEALACNLPIVSVAVGDVRERIAEVAGCYLCENPDPAALAEKLDHVLQQRQRTNGRTTVQTIDEQYTVQQTIAVYKAALEAK
ncbi:MAG: glycosyltransferase [Anaerolineae bacterium]|nr:glycosyltransferase [Anaerolineae bacterium]